MERGRRLRLSAGQLAALPGFADHDASDEPGGLARAELIRVGPDAVSHPAGLRPAVSQMKRERTWRVAGRDPHRYSQLPPGVLKLHNVAGTKLQAVGQRGSDERSVMPGELRERLGKFLQPAVIGEAPVPQRGIGTEQDVDLGRLALWLV